MPATLPQQKIHDFFLSYYPRHYSKNNIILHAGSQPEGVYYLEFGCVRQYDINNRGDEIVMNVLKQEACFPLSWAFNGTRNAYFFETATAATVRIAPPEDVLTFLASQPDALLDITSRTYLQVDSLLTRMTHSMGGNASSRLLVEVLIAARQFGTPSRNGGCNIAISGTELAARSGLTRETVSREMQKFKRAGLLDLTKNGVHIIDIAQLERQLETT